MKEFSTVQLAILQFVPFIMAVIFHEYAHGRVAKYWGDKTAERMGRLTLNPIPHIDPIGTVALPLLGMLSGLNVLFGWAKPVPIDPMQFRKFRPGLFWVSIAGVGMNVFLAFFSAALFGALQRFLPEEHFLHEPLTGMALISISMNYMLGVFNLLPIPPLDGSKIIESFLSYNQMRKYESFAQYGNWIIIGLLLTGGFKILLFPVHFLTQFTLMLVLPLFGVASI